MTQVLQPLLTNIQPIVTIGDVSIAISDIVFDSRKITAGSLFVAQKGTQTDGHQYIQKVIEMGAVAILCENLPTELSPNITYIQVENSAAAMGKMASEFYGNPSAKLKLVGVTGTNGKTSVATLLFKLFRELQYNVGLLSTVQNQVNEEIIPSTHTTPDAVQLNALLAEMVRRSCTHCFIEVSSHAVVQERIAGLTFAGGLFTNITHDHLDFHLTFDNYIKAKKSFFDQLPKTAFALTNIDDRRGSVMVQNTKATISTYSLQTLATFKGRLVSDSLFGLQMEVDNQEVWFKLIGKFNAYNLLCVYGAALLMGEEKEQILISLSAITPPPGRFEQVVSQSQIVGIVDYAHTPDALQNVLETIEELREDSQQIITVVGCGGNRDAAKRPEMTRIACELSHKVILTSDNPRLENPADILDQMEAGIPPLGFKKTVTIADRRAAICHAVSLAQPHDIILVAGKGHETYQDIAGTKHHFDDREELRNAFSRCSY
jgi:UDP-N-acetylmuramoyl-L-alanyl-D-glutamate--2,6-diaminopimelate ligase